MDSVYTRSKMQRVFAFLNDLFEGKLDSMELVDRLPTASEDTVNKIYATLNNAIYQHATGGAAIQEYDFDYSKGGTFKIAFWNRQNGDVWVAPPVGVCDDEKTVTDPQVGDTLAITSENGRVGQGTLTFTETGVKITADYYSHTSIWAIAKVGSDYARMYVTLLINGVYKWIKINPDVEGIAADIEEVASELDTKPDWDDLTNDVSINVLPAKDAGTYEHNGITYVVALDGRITANGTASATANSLLTITTSLQPKSGERYWLSGCPSGGGDSAYFIICGDGSNNVRDRGSGVYFTASANDTVVQIVIYKGTTVTDLVFTPMLVREKYKNKVFTSHIPTNEELAEDAVSKSKVETITGQKTFSNTNIVVEDTSVDKYTTYNHNGIQSSGGSLNIESSDSNIYANADDIILNADGEIKLNATRVLFNNVEYNPGTKLYLHEITFRFRSVYDVIENELPIVDRWRDDGKGYAIGIARANPNTEWRELIYNHIYINDPNVPGLEQRPIQCILDDIQRGDETYEGGGGNGNQAELYLLSKSSANISTMDALKTLWRNAQILSLNPYSYYESSRGIKLLGFSDSGEEIVLHLTPELSGYTSKDFLSRFENGSGEAILVINSYLVKDWTDTVTEW